MTVSVKTKADGDAFSATTATGNAVAVTTEVIKPSCFADYTVLVQVDEVEFQVLAQGETRGIAQLRDGGIFTKLARADKDANLNF